MNRWIQQGKKRSMANKGNDSCQAPLTLTISEEGGGGLGRKSTNYTHTHMMMIMHTPLPSKKTCDSAVCRNVVFLLLLSRIVLSGMCESKIATVSGRMVLLLAATNIASLAMISSCGESDDEESKCSNSGMSLESKACASG